MKTFRISAKLVGYLEQHIEANNAEEAYEMLEHLLVQGALPEIDGWIEGQQVEEIK